jgi:hypothetical protein
VGPIYLIILAIGGGVLAAYHHDFFWLNFLLASVACAIFVWVRRRDMDPKWVQELGVARLLFRQRDYLFVGFALWLTFSLAAFALASASYWLARTFIWH